jgi:hypothetical protein
MKRIISLLVVITIILTLGCAQQTRTVARISTDEVTDLRGDWNDTDSRLVAENMVKDLLYRPWLSNFVSDEDRQPVVIVGTVRNKSTEHIQTETFVKDIERELVNSGQVEFVADAKARDEIRKERMEQQSFASDDTAKRLAAESGADFMLQGTITSNVDAIDGKEAKFYQVDLELINVESNKKVWIGSKEIKKFVQKAKNKW